MNTNDMIILARKHRNEGSMSSSARSCLEDAVKQHDEGNDKAARMWALKSLAYSVGVFNRDYIKAAR